MNLHQHNQLSTHQRELEGIIAVSKYLLFNKNNESKQQVGWDYLRFRIGHLLSLKTSPHE